MVLVKTNEALTDVRSKYADFADIFFPNPAVKLSEYTKINNHAIDLIDSKQPFYGLIYGFGQV